MEHYLYNHVRLIVRYSEEPESFIGSRVVGFEVVPFSIKHKYDDEVYVKGSTILKTCNTFTLAKFDADNLQPVENSNEEVIYTYDVQWEKSELLWANRWDIYLRGNPEDEIHYFSIVNSFMVVLFLTGVVAMIMLRTLRKDISTYNEVQSLEEAQEESGEWGSEL